MERKYWKLQEFVAHGSSVNCLCLNNSGRTLATGGDDRKVNLWAIGKPNVLMSFTGHTSPVESVTFNEGETWIGAGSKSGAIRVFDLQQNKVIRALSGHKSGVRCLDFHRYGDILASGSMDSSIKIWDIRRKGCVITYSEHRDMVTALQFSPDGRWVASGSEDGTAKIWDLVAGKKIASFTEHESAVNSVRFSPKEYLLATGGNDRMVKFWDLEQYELVSSSEVEATAIRSISFDLEGRALFSVSQDSLRLYQWEPAAVCLDSLAMQWGRLDDFVVNNDQLIAASHSNTNVSVWVVNIKKLRPFSGEPLPSRDVSKPPNKTTTLRKRFDDMQTDQPRETHPLSGKPQETRPQTVSTKARTTSAPAVDDLEDDNIPEADPKEREAIFLPCRTMARTPPKNVYEPFVPPSEENPAIRPSKGQCPPQLPLPSEEPHPPANLGESTELPIADFIPPSRPVPVGVDQEQRTPQLTDEQALTKMAKNHKQLSAILRSRLDSTKQLHTKWKQGDVKAALEEAVGYKDLSVFVDVLNVLKQKKGLWSLGVAVVAVSEVLPLISSKHEAFNLCGCDVVTLILKTFGPLIIETLTAPSSGGVDFSREERIKKCEILKAHLTSIESEINRRQDFPHISSAVRKKFKQCLSLYTVHLPIN